MKKFSMVEVLEQLFNNDGIRKRSESDALHNKLFSDKGSINSTEDLEAEMTEALKESREDVDALKSEIYENIKKTNSGLFSVNYSRKGANGEAGKMYNAINTMISTLKTSNSYDNYKSIRGEYDLFIASNPDKTANRIARLQFALKLINCCPSSGPFEIAINGEFDENTIKGMLYFQLHSPHYINDATKNQKGYKVDGYFMSRTLNSLTKTLRNNETFSSDVGEEIINEGFEKLNFTATGVDPLTFEVSKTAPFVIKAGSDLITTDNKSYSKKIPGKGEWKVAYDNTKTTSAEAWKATFTPETMPAPGFEKLNFTATGVDPLTFEVSKTAPFVIKAGSDLITTDNKSYSKKIPGKGEWKVAYDNTKTTSAEAWKATFTPETMPAPGFEKLNFTATGADPLSFEVSKTAPFALKTGADLSTTDNKNYSKKIPGKGEWKVIYDNTKTTSAEAWKAEFYPETMPAPGFEKLNFTATGADPLSFEVSKTAPFALKTGADLSTTDNKNYSKKIPGKGEWKVIYDNTKTTSAEAWKAEFYPETMPAPGFEKLNFTATGADPLSFEVSKTAPFALKTGADLSTTDNKNYSKKIPGKGEWKVIYDNTKTTSAEAWKAEFYPETMPAPGFEKLNFTATGADPLSFEVSKTAPFALKTGADLSTTDNKNYSKKIPGKGEWKVIYDNTKTTSAEAWKAEFYPETMPAPGFEKLNFTATGADPLSFEVSKTAPFALKTGADLSTTDNKNYSKKIPGKGEWKVIYDNTKTTSAEAWKAEFYPETMPAPGFEKLNFTATGADPLSFEVSKTAPFALKTGADLSTTDNKNYSKKIPGKGEWKVIYDNTKTTSAEAWKAMFTPETNPVDPIPANPEINQNLPENLKSLKANAQGKITGWKEGVDYYLQKGSSRRKLNQIEKDNSRFINNQKISLSNNPKQNEILTIKLDNQKIQEDEKSVLVPEENNGNVVDNEGLPNFISSGSYEREQKMKSEFFTSNFPELNLDNYPDDKERTSIQSFITENIATIKDSDISVQEKIDKIQNITDQLNDPSKNTKNRLPSGIDNGNVIFNGKKLSEKTGWFGKLRKNDKNEKVVFYNAMAIYKNQIMFHINNTNQGVYNYKFDSEQKATHLKRSTNFNETDANLTAQRENYQETDVLENKSREKLNTWYSEYNQKIQDLTTVVTRDNVLEAALTKDNYGTNLSSKVDDQIERITLMKRKVALESGLILLGKKIDYLQGLSEKGKKINDLNIEQTGIETGTNKPLIKKEDATKQIIKLKGDAKNIIEGVETFIKDNKSSDLKNKISDLQNSINELNTFITKESTDPKNPSIIDIESMLEDTSIDLNESSKTILDAKEIIKSNSIQKEQKEQELNALQPGDKEYSSKYSELSSAISAYETKIKDSQETIKTANEEFKEALGGISNIVIHDYYSGLQENNSLLVPLSDKNNKTIEIQTKITESYNDKQFKKGAEKTKDNGIQVRVETNNEDIKISNTQRSVIDIKKSTIKEKISGKDGVGGIDKTIKDEQDKIAKEQKKINASESPDTGIILTSQNIILEQNKSKQQKIAEYNTLHFETVVTYQQELFIEKEQINSYHSATSNNVNHLRENSTLLKSSIEERILKFNQIKNEYIKLLDNNHSLNDAKSNISYNKSQRDNLINQAKIIYKEINGTEDGYNWNSLSTEKDLSFATLTDKNNEFSLFSKYKKSEKLLMSENLKLTKRSLLANYQQSRIDLVGIEAQFKMLSENINIRKKYISEVLQKQINDNFGIIQNFESKNITLSGDLSKASNDDDRARIRQNIVTNNASILDLKGRNQIINTQIELLTNTQKNGKIDIAEKSLIGVQEKYEIAKGIKDNLKSDISKNTTAVYKDGSNSNIEFNISKEEDVEGKIIFTPFSKI